jgi:hypothetical protein
VKLSQTKDDWSSSLHLCSLESRGTLTPPLGTVEGPWRSKSSNPLRGQVVSTSRMHRPAFSGHFPKSDLIYITKSTYPRPQKLSRLKPTKELTCTLQDSAGVPTVEAAAQCLQQQGSRSPHTDLAKVVSTRSQAQEVSHQVLTLPQEFKVVELHSHKQTGLHSSGQQKVPTLAACLKPLGNQESPHTSSNSPAAKEQPPQACIFLPLARSFRAASFLQ